MNMNFQESDRYRPLLENDPPSFIGKDRVDDPWDTVPDLEDYNLAAYCKIDWTLTNLNRARESGTKPTSQGILVLGEAGTGKTHLLMRVARKRSETNQILFVPKPNNEEAVAQHIWTNMVLSLAKSSPKVGSKRSQLDVLSPMCSHPC
jgi:predicted ATP-dependent serine protease